MKHLSIGIFFIFCFNAVMAQTSDSLKFNNRKFKYEIGIDVKNIFGGFNSTALILKIRNDRGKLISVSYAKNWRFQLVSSSSINNEKLKSFESNGILFNFGQSGFELWSFQPAFGFERVNFFKRFNFYYGADFGFSYQHSKGANAYYGYYIENGTYNGFEFSHDSDSFGPNATAFVGMKYRINDRFSVSLESAFGLSLQFAKTKIRDALTDETAASSSHLNFTHAFTPLRFLTFNYHFKQY